MRKRFWIGAALLLFLGFTITQFRVKADSTPHHLSSLPTFYSYPTQRLHQLRSTYLINESQVAKWEQPLALYIKEQNISDVDQLRFYTYLYLVQRDAAFLSYNVHQCFIGSLDPLTETLVKRFFPGFSDFPPIDRDEYSTMLADLVLSKYLAHLKEEDENKRSYSGRCQTTDIPDALDQIASWIPWNLPVLKPSPPPPLDDHTAWTEQMKELEAIRAHLTPEQEELAILWAGPQGLSRHWRELTSRYLQENKIPFAKEMLVKAILLMGLYDGTIAVINAKYTYCLPRPAQMDPAIHLLISDPKTPSYPSGHAAQGAVAGHILAHFFPESRAYWINLGDEAGQSRLFAGVHFPHDVVQGRLLGQKIASQALRTLKQE